MSSSPPLTLGEEVSLYGNRPHAGFRSPCNPVDFQKKAGSAASRATDRRVSLSEVQPTSADKSSHAARRPQQDSHIPRTQRNLRSTTVLGLADPRNSHLMNVEVEGEEDEVPVKKSQKLAAICRTTGSDGQEKFEESSIPDILECGRARRFVETICQLRSSPDKLTQIRVSNAWWALNAMREYHVVRVAPDYEALLEKASEEAMQSYECLSNRCQVGHNRNERLLTEKQREWDHSYAKELECLSGIDVQTLKLTLEHRSGGAILEEASADLATEATQHFALPGFVAASDAGPRRQGISPTSVLKDLHPADSGALRVSEEGHNEGHTLQARQHNATVQSTHQASSGASLGHQALVLLERGPLQTAEGDMLKSNLAAKEKLVMSLQQTIGDRDIENKKLREMLVSLSHSNSALTQVDKRNLELLLDKHGRRAEEQQTPGTNILKRDAKKHESTVSGRKRKDRPSSSQYSKAVAGAASTSHENPRDSTTRAHLPAEKGSAASSFLAKVQQQKRPRKDTPNVAEVLRHKFDCDMEMAERPKPRQLATTLDQVDEGEEEGGDEEDDEEQDGRAVEEQEAVEEREAFVMKEKASKSAGTERAHSVEPAVLTVTDAGGPALSAGVRLGTTPTQPRNGQLIGSGKVPAASVTDGLREPKGGARQDSASKGHVGFQGKLSLMSPPPPRTASMQSARENKRPQAPAMSSVSTDSTRRQRNSLTQTASSPREGVGLDKGIQQVKPASLGMAQSPAPQKSQAVLTTGRRALLPAASADAAFNRTHSGSHRSERTVRHGTSGELSPGPPRPSSSFTENRVMLGGVYSNLFKQRGFRCPAVKSPSSAQSAPTA